MTGVGTNRSRTARTDWNERIGHRSGATTATETPAVAPPTGLRADVGRGQVTLHWAPVAGAVGYLVHHAEDRAGPFRPLDHGGKDVLSVPHSPYTDTTAPTGRARWYAVASLADIEAVGELSEPVVATPSDNGTATVTVSVNAAEVTRPLPRPWRPMIGSEHLSLLLSPDTIGGRPISSELAEALRIAHTELGVEAVRAHGILCDDLGVYTETAGRVRYDFTGIDKVYDAVLELGLRPVVELSFMPRDLASDPTKTVFAYDAIVSPPKDWDRWADLVQSLTGHLVERYGLEEVRDRWSFEVWNEANLEVFWSGTPEEYWRLYDVSAHAVKQVDADLKVGGPGSAAAGWVSDQLAHVRRSGAPIDFVSTHTYGVPPLDLRPILARHDHPHLATWWTEWGVTPQHDNPVSDSVFSATFLLRGMRSAAGRLDALSYWVASDHFEELGRPERLFHGGFGLLTVGGLRKPRFWALALLERLGSEELATRLDGDGAGGLVEAWAARDENGRVGVLAWNGTLDQSKAAGDPTLARQIRLRVTGLSAAAVEVRHLRVDDRHSNITAMWRQLGGGDWPDDGAWAELRSANRLDELEPPHRVEVSAGTVELDFPLPMPGISYLDIVPLRQGERDG